MQHLNLKKRRAFTLIEILIAVSIFMTTMIVAVAIFTTTVSSSSMSEQLRLTAQSARFIFESISREIRLARGLVQIDADGNRIVLIPPFEVAGSEVRVYQTKRKGTSSTGEPTYVIIRKLYGFNVGLPDLAVHTEIDTENGQGVTTYQIACNIHGIGCIAPDTQDKDFFWRLHVNDSQDTVKLLPNNFVADKFEVTAFRNYPSATENLDILTVQPFIQLQLAVENSKYNSARKDNRKVRTTLQTTIVPREFISPYEVIQQGVGN